MEKEKKKCPYCGQEILAIAKKCKHCGEWLDSTNINRQVVISSPHKSDITKIIIGVVAYFAMVFIIYAIASNKNSPTTSSDYDYVETEAVDAVVECDTVAVVEEPYYGY